MSIKVLSAIRSRMPALAIAGLTAVVGIAGFGHSAAAIAFDQNITPDVIFGSGVTDGGWTVEQANGVEVGLRAKVRFDNGGSPQNIFNSAGNGTYIHQAGQHSNNGRARWSFEWSINIDYDNTTGRLLGTAPLSYEIRIDKDPGLGVDFLSFDPINVGCGDHATGTNATGQGGGATRTCTQPVPSLAEMMAYDADLAVANVAQNSWQINFFADPFPGGFPIGFDPGTPGNYEFELIVAGPDVGEVVTRITVLVSEPGTLAVFGLGLLGLGLARRKRMA